MAHGLGKRRRGLIMNIDKLMAEHVMGWGDRGDWWETDGKHYDHEDWIPTQDLNQAMEGLIESDRLFTIRYAGKNFGYEVALKTWSVNGDIVVTDKELPLAICKAILKAKGVDYE